MLTQERLKEQRLQYEEYLQELNSGSRKLSGQSSSALQKAKTAKKSSAHAPVFGYYLTRNAFQGHYLVVLLMEKIPSSYVSLLSMCYDLSPYLF